MTREMSNSANSLVLIFVLESTSRFCYCWPESSSSEWCNRIVFVTVQMMHANQLLQLCTARTVFSIGHCTVIHCDDVGVSLVDQ